jgi:hypothetical protein
MRALVVLALFVAGCARPTGNGLPSSAEAECASCHVDHAAGFESSAHAHATESPVFQALLPRVASAWGEAARDRCTSCHEPPHGDDASISCVSCHAAVGNLGARDGRLVLDVDAPIMGPFAGAHAPHATRTSGLLTSGELCASCHEVTGPDLFVERTGTEHASAMADLGAPECATCHVPGIADGPVAPGGAIRARHDHRFVGLDPAWNGTDEERRASTDAARALLASALELRIVDGSVELENVGAGHAVPTGVAFLRDVWVDVDLTHADGTTETLARAIELGDRPMRGTTPVPLPTDADHVEERRLAPFEIRRVALAPDVVHVEATLRVRPMRADALDALGIDPGLAPAIDVTTVTR